MTEPCLALIILLPFLQRTSANPLVVPPSVNPQFQGIPKGFCFLPPEMGPGSYKYLEDCDSIDQFDTLPIPAPSYEKVGTHSMVCCPKKRHKDHICFPTNAWCPIYIPFPVVEYEYDYEYDYSSDESQFVVQQQPTMADRQCYGEGIPLNTCVKVDQCQDLINLALSTAPRDAPLVIQPCGFDEDDNTLMVCCPNTMINSFAEVTKKPRFPLASGAARKCTDNHELCPKWKSNNGCALDKNFKTSEDPNGNIESKTMFDFMQDTCVDSCGWCGEKGCVDELPDCVGWARNGMCVVNPLFMAHTCRESCGVCGFLSPFNNEEQILNGNSYSDLTKDSFDCGRLKLLSEIGSQRPLMEDELTKTKGTIIATENISENENFKESEDEIDLQPSGGFFVSSQGLKSADGGGKTDYFCGATVISDRWMVSASHCYDDFAVELATRLGTKKVTVETIRANTVNKEAIEIKRIFTHPLYKFPNLYNDVAVIELGRRIEYNYTIFGDTPSCLDRGLFTKTGKTATIQGFGLTENSTRGDLLATNVTIITNTDCKQMLEHNITVAKTTLEKNQMKAALPQGLNYGLLCAQGEQNENGVFRGSCKGDSGGPLFTKNEDKNTLVGIVSGGLGCGDGYPGWYTHVAFYAEWIQCIIQTSESTPGKGRNLKEIQESCQHTVKKPKKCEELTAEDTFFGDLRSDDQQGPCGGRSEDEVQYGGLTSDADEIIFGDLRNDAA